MADYDFAIYCLIVGGMVGLVIGVALCVIVDAGAHFITDIPPCLPNALNCETYNFNSSYAEKTIPCIASVCENGTLTMKCG
jgi:hypothetical protein